MPDITKCYGKECPNKENCFRYVVPAGEYQSYSGFDEERGENGICRMFWDIRFDDSANDNGFNLIDKNGGAT